MTDLSGHAGLFLTAVGEGTMLPVRSEIVLVALLLAGGYEPGALVLIAGLGNTLGSALNWFVGAIRRALSRPSLVPGPAGGAGAGAGPLPPLRPLVPALELAAGDRRRPHRRRRGSCASPSAPSSSWSERSRRRATSPSSPSPRAGFARDGRARSSKRGLARPHRTSEPGSVLADAGLAGE